jgi:hypothetical protein
MNELQAEGGYMLKPPSNNSRAPKDHRAHQSEGMDTLTPNTTRTRSTIGKEGETP